MSANMSANLSANSDEIVELNHRFSFESAHHLPEVAEDHKCRRLHGHSFQVEVTVTGSIGQKTGWVMDFADLKARVRPVIEALDHRYLNEIEGLENPTSEHICIWIWNRLAKDLPGLTAVSVNETCNNGCTYRGNSSDGS